MTPDADSIRISIHALRVEGDKANVMRGTTLPQFLSTPSGWRATLYPGRVSGCHSRCISIHALRVEGDGLRIARVPPCRISIHALRVEGDGNHNRRVVSKEWISIHALRVEGDLTMFPWSLKQPQFLSTPSGWRATAFMLLIVYALSAFLSTPSGWRATTEPSEEVAFV